jgi:hypothetical protein
MEQIPPRVTTVLGIDPGRNTGLYSVSIPTVSHALTLDEFQRHARWLGNAAISLSTRDALSPIEKWSALAEALRGAINNVRPDLIVLEYPADRMASWTGGSAQGTEFHMGMFFGFAALAAQEWAAASCLPDGVKVALMPVTSSKKKNRVGWMPRVKIPNSKRNLTHVQDQETTLRQCREIAHWIGIESGQRSEDVDALSKHELMALGVLTYYVTHRSPSEWSI